MNLAKQRNSFMKLSKFFIEKIEPYPPKNLSHLVKRVDNFEKGIQRDWTGNDDSARNHHGVVTLNESPLKLRLSWKKSAKDSAKLVGVFEINLRELLKGGYVRSEPNTENAIRLRFYHGSDDVIYVQVKRNEPSLPIGKISL